MRRILTARVWAIMTGSAAALLLASLAYIWVVRPALPAREATPLPAVLTIQPGPTSTAAPRPATRTSAPPTPFPTRTPLANEIAVGRYVQVQNTGGEGLRIRSDPGLDSPVLFSGFDSEAFLVSGGPEQADEYTWWYLTASYDQARAGWAVADYLSVIEAEAP